MERLLLISILIEWTALCLSRGVPCVGENCNEVISVPLVDGMKATLKADLDVSQMNKYLKAYIQQEISKGVRTAVEGFVEQMIENKTEKLKAEIIASLEGKTINASCISTKECKEALTCTNGYCECSSLEYWDGSQCLRETKEAKECSDIESDINGVYTVYPVNRNTPVQVYCIMENNKKWTVLQRRANESVDFNRNWNEYRAGFGSRYGEYWLGNENIHAISTNGNHELSIFMISSSDEHGYANYSTFSMSDESSKYVLTVSGFHGNAGDSINFGKRRNYAVNGHKFSTKDQDNDNYSKYNCADRFEGGWWFNGCHAAHLNGKPQKSGRKWHPWASVVKYSVMMMRKTN